MSEITYTLVKCGCSIYFFLNSAILICRGTDISKYLRKSLGIRDNESGLYSSSHDWANSIDWPNKQNWLNTAKDAFLSVLTLLSIQRAYLNTSLSKQINLFHFRIFSDKVITEMNYKALYEKCKNICVRSEQWKHALLVSSWRG